MKYLIDTNICIYIIKKKYSFLLEKIEKTGLEQIGISSITLAEMEYGIEKSANTEQNRMALIEFLLPFEIIDFDRIDSFIYGTIRNNLKKKGTPIGPMDMLLASQAINRNLIFVTNNEKEFSRVEKLKIENWSKNIST